METAEALKYIRLLDDRGDDMTDALLDLTDGLWTTNGKILTILFHPGRIKTGLAAGDLYGSIFTEGCTYQLVVDRTIVDASGQPLEKDYHHYFQVSSAIRQGFKTIPDKLLLSENTVRIETNQPLDWLSIQTYLAITDEFDNLVPSHFSVTADGKAIVICIRDFKDKEQRYLQVHPKLEDIAGNQANIPFEIFHNA